MTNFDKVKNYYKNFDEKNRLKNDNSGKLEYYMTIKILEDNLPSSGTILDLGGGAGVYSFPLAGKGYNVYLSDLSEDLINEANKIGIRIITVGLGSVDTSQLNQIASNTNGKFYYANNNSDLFEFDKKIFDELK